MSVREVQEGRALGSRIFSNDIKNSSKKPESDILEERKKKRLNTSESGNVGRREGKRREK